MCAVICCLRLSQTAIQEPFLKSEKLTKVTEIRNFVVNPLVF